LLLFATRERDKSAASGGRRPRANIMRAVDFPGHKTAAQQLARSPRFFMDHETLGLN
jgi:hypothetical protein